MSKRFLLIFMILMFWNIAYAEAGAWEDFAGTFSAFMGKLSIIGDNAEHQYLKDKLEQLHRNLYEIEKDKDYLLILLRRQNPELTACVSVVESLKKNVGYAQKLLRKIGDRVARVSSEASLLETFLSNAITSRKEWLGRVGQSCSMGADTALLSDGELAMNAIHDARIQLEEALRCDLKQC